MSVGVSMHGSVQSSGLLVQGNKSYADLFKTSHSLPRVAPTTSVVAAQVYRSQQVGQSEDSLIGVPIHSSRVGAVPVSSESPSSILDVSAGAVVSISSAVSMVGQGSKVGKDSVSLLVSFAQPIVSSVVSVDELDDRKKKYLLLTEKVSDLDRLVAVVVAVADGSVDGKMSVHKSHLVVVTLGDAGDEILDVAEGGPDGGAGLAGPELRFDLQLKLAGSLISHQMEVEVHVLEVVAELSSGYFHNVLFFLFK
ncbi:hypothetical protein LWI29_027193 [Acer saccharum]|uniref:Uncharacterized protein n=1 Tax=Acer saccharum TaxID=4024 RepID=A0AA39VUD5_ACESA|nr:hypothetical protein LWI29_027193 [Acer saccharum]